MPSQCFHALRLHPALLSHMLPLRTKGQDVAGCSRLMGDLSGMLPKGKAVQEHRSLFFVFRSEGPLYRDPLHELGGCPTKSLLGSPPEQWLMFGGTSCGHGLTGL